MKHFLIWIPPLSLVARKLLFALFFFEAGQRLTSFEWSNPSSTGLAAFPAFNCDLVAEILTMFFKHPSFFSPRAQPSFAQGGSGQVPLLYFMPPPEGPFFSRE